MQAVLKNAKPNLYMSPAVFQEWLMAICKPEPTSQDVSKLKDALNSHSQNLSTISPKVFVHVLCTLIKVGEAGEAAKIIRIAEPVCLNPIFVVDSICRISGARISSLLCIKYMKQCMSHHNPSWLFYFPFFRI